MDTSLQGGWGGGGRGREEAFTWGGMGGWDDLGGGGFR